MTAPIHIIELRLGHAIINVDRGKRRGCLEYAHRDDERLSLSLRYASDIFRHRRPICRPWLDEHHEVR